MRVSDVLACSFPNWYPLFSKVSARSLALPIPDDVLDYLRSEGSVVLPKECDSDWRDGKGKDNNDSDDSDSSSNHDFDDEEDDESSSPPRPTFPAFSASVKEAVERLGGSDDGGVFCKLNWSAPRDAAWVGFGGNNLRCTNLSEIYLLLKSSDFVRHDLTQPFKDCEDDEDRDKVQYHLVLRRWCEINPGHEFRCFVRGGVLVGICQRDGTSHYRHIAGERESIVGDVSTFFDEHIKGRFPLDDFVFDLVRAAKDSVRLVDFNPFGVTTDSVLFDWDELMEKKTSEEEEQEDGVLQFRFVENDSGIQPNGLRQYSVPLDVVDLASGADADKLVDFLKLQQKQQQQQSAPLTRDP